MDVPKLIFGGIFVVIALMMVMFLIGFYSSPHETPCKLYFADDNVTLTMNDKGEQFYQVDIPNDVLLMPVDYVEEKCIPLQEKLS